MGLLGFLKKRNEKEEEDTLPPLDIESPLNQQIPQSTQINTGFPNNFQQQPIQNTMQQPSIFQQSSNPLPQPQPTLPQYTEPQPPQQRDIYEGWVTFIQSVVSPMIDEKIKDLKLKLTTLEEWKEKTETELNLIKKDIKKVEDRLNEIYDKLMEKITDYDASIKETSAEVKALHRVLQSMIPAISESVRELKGTIEELKKLKENLP